MRTPNVARIVVVWVTLLTAYFVAPFAGTYLSMSHGSASSFTETLNHISALYFTVTTLATVGFGDISAVSDTARSLVIVPTLLDLLLLGSIVKLLAAAVNRDLDQPSGVASESPAPADQ